MTYFNVNKLTHLEFEELINEDYPTLTGFNTDIEESHLKVPRHLNTTKEDTLLENAFRLLFHLNIARQTKTPVNIEKLHALEGNRLLKKKHPLNFFYDLQFVAAKTQIQGYLHNTSVALNYNRSALRIYGRCFLFAQLDLIAQTGSVPDNLGKAFYFLPKGSFTEEFEQMNQLALKQFISQLTPKDTVQFYPISNDRDIDWNHKAFLLNDTLVLVDTSEKGINKEHELKDILKLFSIQNVKQKEQLYTVEGSFSKIGIYRARYGEMMTLDIQDFLKNISKA